jgi:2-polyprenyl-6-methoxyphenol hydroxylase-like FAD-dependent oxidoreductase
MSQDRLSHAIVVGGSLAGMLTARVLSHHFNQVTIVERDEYPESPAPRPGIPQSRHLHGLLLRGTRILENLFPGISAELLQSGALKLDAGDDLKWLMPRGWGAL